MTTITTMSTMIPLTTRRRAAPLHRLLALAGLAALAASAGPAQAVDLAFSITNDPAPPYFNYYGRPHVDGTVTGVLRGLTDNAGSQPTAIDFISGGTAIGLTARHVASFSTVMGSLTLENGQAVHGGLQINFDDPAVGALMLTFNASGFYGSGINMLAWNGGSGPILSIGNARGLAGANLAAVSAVPEPDATALLAAGLVALAWLGRRRALPG